MLPNQDSVTPPTHIPGQVFSPAGATANGTAATTSVIPVLSASQLTTASIVLPPIVKARRSKMPLIAGAMVITVLIGGSAFMYLMRTNKTDNVQPASPSLKTIGAASKTGTVALNPAPITPETKGTTPTVTTKPSAPAVSTKPSTPIVQTTKTPDVTSQSAIDAAKAFIAAIQSGDKTKADNFQSLKFKTTLKQSTQYDSYYDYCKSNQLCKSYSWFDLSKAESKQENSTLTDGSAVQLVTLSVTTVTDGATSKNSLLLKMSVNGSSWLLEDIEQSFNGSYN